MNSDPTISSETDRSSRLVLITGPAGAGLSTALNALEDVGFEAIDNLPLSLLPRLLDGRPLERPLALTVDTRNRDFSTDDLTAAADSARAISIYDVTLVYLECRPDVLLRRFSETRRRHPFSQEGAPAVGIRRELDLVSPLQSGADLVLDTSDFSPHDLRAALGRRFGSETGQMLRISVESFSFKRGTPQDLDIVFDVRFLANPHWSEELRTLDGQAPEVFRFVAGDPRFGPFREQVTALILFMLPAFVAEGKTHLSIGFGCTGGRHRSVAVAENIAAALAAHGWGVSTRHRGLNTSDQPAGSRLMAGGDL